MTTTQTPLSADASSASVTSVLFLRDAVTFAAGSAGDSTVKLWDCRNLAQPVALAGGGRAARGTRPRGVTALATDAQGSRILAAYSDSTARPIAHRTLHIAV